MLNVGIYFTIETGFEAQEKILRKSRLTNGIKSIFNVIDFFHDFNNVQTIGLKLFLVTRRKWLYNIMVWERLLHELREVH